MVYNENMHNLFPMGRQKYAATERKVPSSGREANERLEMDVAIRASLYRHPHFLP